MSVKHMKPRQFTMDDATHDRLKHLARKLGMNKACTLRFIINQIDDSFLPFVTFRCTVASNQQIERKEEFTA